MRPSSEEKGGRGARGAARLAQHPLHACACAPHGCPAARAMAATKPFALTRPPKPARGHHYWLQMVYDTAEARGLFRHARLILDPSPTIMRNGNQQREPRVFGLNTCRCVPRTARRPYFAPAARGVAKRERGGCVAACRPVAGRGTKLSELKAL